MRTKIPLEELLNDTPQNRSLIRLFEEDTYNLRSWSHKLTSCLDEWCAAQKLATIAASKFADVVSSYREQNFPLDEASYEIPAITSRIAQTLSEINSWMEILIQQVECCVQYPFKKIAFELDELVEHVRPNYADALSNLADSEEKFARAGRRDAPRKLDELNNDVFISKMGYHKLALQYCSRMNVLQNSRYTQLVEPLLAMLYACRSYFNVGHDCFRGDALTQFLTHAQQQMQQIDKAGENERKEGQELLQSLCELSKVERDIYYGERESHPADSTDILQKQGYLRIKLKSGLFTNNWEKYFVFTQGANLMWQKADQLAGSLMLDLTAVPGTSAQIAGENAERRFVFVICVPAAEDSANAGDRRWMLQAKNTADLQEWVRVINNLSGSQKHTCESESDPGTLSPSPVDTRSALTPSNTPICELSQLMLSGEPIQFDFSSSSACSSTNVTDVISNSKVSSFDVRFLGCVEVPSDQGGDAMVQLTIDRVLGARSAHSISASTACRILICDAARAVFLVDRAQPTVLKAQFDLADIAFWTTHSSERVFALVTRSRVGRESSGDAKPVGQPQYLCSVLSTEDSADGSDVCKALTEASRESLNNLIRKKSQQMASQSDASSNSEPGTESK